MKQALPLSFYTVQLVANFSWVFIYLEAKDLLAVSFVGLQPTVIADRFARAAPAPRAKRNDD